MHFHGVQLVGCIQMMLHNVTSVTSLDTQIYTSSTTWDTKVGESKLNLPWLTVRKDPSVPWPHYLSDCQRCVMHCHPLKSGLNQIIRARLLLFSFFCFIVHYPKCKTSLHVLIKRHPNTLLRQLTPQIVPKYHSQLFPQMHMILNYKSNTWFNNWFNWPYSPLHFVFHLSFSIFQSCRNSVTWRLVP